MVNEDPDGDGANVTLNIRFPGQYYDQESYLHYNYFRDYDPTIGQYIQPDPIGLAGGLNPYAYAHNNPILYIDPLGLSTTSDAPNPSGRPSFRPSLDGLLCSLYNAICADRDAAIQEEIDRYNSNLEGINQTCDSNVNNCRYQPDEEFMNCIAQQGEACREMESEENERHQDALDKINEIYPRNDDIESLCD